MSQKSQLMCKLLIICLLSVTPAFTWKCGIGPFSEAVSFAIAFPADVPGINNCCLEHDALLDGLHVARREADRVFCQCLAANSNWYVRSIVKPLFCTTVEVYTKWVENHHIKQAVKKIIPTDFRFHRYFLPHPAH